MSIFMPFSFCATYCTLSVATEVILLRAGKIVDAAPVQELIEKYAPGQGLEEVYLAVFGEGDGK